ncbi:hypothetical protein ACS0TY_020352 [Phlomoides rotata]
MATEVKAENIGRNTWRPHLAKEKDYEAFRELFRHHIDSFDHMVKYGLEKMLMSIKPVECRQAKLTYAGQFLVYMNFQYDDGVIVREKINLGQLPIMLKSKLCHLKAANDPKKMVLHKEEPSEMGGYFILNGLERVIRLLILPKRNYPMSMVRNSFRERREGYTDKAVVIRCVREDQSAVTVKLYYLNNGSARLGFWIQGREYLLPVGIILKALTETTDHEIYVSLTCCYNEKYDRGSISNLSWWDWKRKATLLDYIYVHLDDNIDKFNLLMLVFHPPDNYLSQVADFKKFVEKTSPRQIGAAIENLLKTGRLATQTGLDLQQCRPRDKIFCVSFHISELFIGVLHLLAFAPRVYGSITSYYDSKGNVKDFLEIRKSVLKVLVSIGMTPSLPKLLLAAPPEVLPVLLDGRVVGSIASEIIEKAVCHLRRFKVSAASVIPEDLEVGYIPLSMGGAYPGLYLFTSASRFVQPVRNILIPPEENTTLN